MKIMVKDRAMRVGASRAFTLIELLVVVMLIIILAGITLRVTVFINQRTGVNKAAVDLERLKHALIEYHSVYGVFPPVNWVNIMRQNYPKWETMEWVYSQLWPNIYMDHLNYTGLSYYLWSPKYEPNRQRWATYVEGMQSLIIRWESNKIGGALGGSGGWATYSNYVSSCLDPWGRAYYYESFDPYQSFRIWSRGPTDITEDDIGITWSE